MRYIKSVLIMCIFFAAVPSVFPASELTYTLEQILAIAGQNAAELKVIDTKFQAGIAEVDIYRSEAMPYVSFGSGASLVSQSQATQKLQQTMMLAMFGGSSGSDESTGGGGSIPYPDRINGYAYNWSLNVQQPIVTFGKVGAALKLARMRHCTLKDLQRLEQDLFYLRVIQEFSAAYSAQLDEVIADAALKRSLQLQTRLVSEYDAGRTIKREVLRIEALVKGDRAKHFAAHGIATTSYQRLLQTINLDDTSIAALVLDPDGSLSEPPPASGPGSIELFLKKNETVLYKQQSKYIRSGFFPTINLVGSIANQFMTIDTNGLVDEFLPEGTPPYVVSNIAQTFDESNPKPDKYFDPGFFNYTIGLQLSWTLFDGNRTRAQYRQAKLKTKQALLELDLMEQNQKTAIREARNQIATIDSTAAAVILQEDAAREALMQTEQDYADGFTDFSTLLDTDKEAREAARLLNSLRIQRVLALAQLRITMGIPVYGENK